MQLVIGNRNYSSWSFRAWLYLTEAGVDFEELRIPLFQGDWREQVAQHTPAGRVPALADGDVRVWDSWAIIEYVRARYPVRLGWPADPLARGEALSIAAEMHAGFLGVRRDLPMNIRARVFGRMNDVGDDTRDEVARIVAAWELALGRHGGPFLFGALSIADVLYAPVVMRFVTYGVAVPPASDTYMDSIIGLDSMQRWIELARAEPETLEFVDSLASATPLRPG